MWSSMLFYHIYITDISWKNTWITVNFFPKIKYGCILHYMQTFFESTRNQSMLGNAFGKMIIYPPVTSTFLACWAYTCSPLSPMWVSCAFALTWRDHCLTRGSVRVKSKSSSSSPPSAWNSCHLVLNIFPASLLGIHTELLVFCDVLSYWTVVIIPTYVPYTLHCIHMNVNAFSFRSHGEILHKWKAINFVQTRHSSSAVAVRTLC